MAGPDATIEVVSVPKGTVLAWAMVATKGGARADFHAFGRRARAARSRPQSRHALEVRPAVNRWAGPVTLRRSARTTWRERVGTRAAHAQSQFPNLVDLHLTRLVHIEFRDRFRLPQRFAVAKDFEGERSAGVAGIVPDPCDSHDHSKSHRFSRERVTYFRGTIGWRNQKDAVRDWFSVQFEFRPRVGVRAVV